MSLLRFGCNPKPPKNLPRIFMMIFILGGTAFVVGHYVFDPPYCSEQAAQTCNCPLW